MDLNGCRQNQRPNSWEKQHNNPQVIHTENPKIEKKSIERQLCGHKCLVYVRGQRRMSRLVRDDRTATEGYNSFIQQGCIKLIKINSKNWKLLQKISISNNCCSFKLYTLKIFIWCVLSIGCYNDFCRITWQWILKKMTEVENSALPLQK